MAIAPGGIELSTDDLRVVARFAVEPAEDVLPLFEEGSPTDGRARAAVEAAWLFVRGANRTKLQRVTALDAHRAAKDAGTGAATHAAYAAGAAGDEPQVGDQRIELARPRATPPLVDVLGRYPLAPTGRNRVAQLMSTLDAALRAG